MFGRQQFALSRLRQHRLEEIAKRLNFRPKAAATSLEVSS